MILLQRVFDGCIVVASGHREIEAMLDANLLKDGSRAETEIGMTKEGTGFIDFFFADKTMRLGGLLVFQSSVGKMPYKRDPRYDRKDGLARYARGGR